MLLPVLFLMSVFILPAPFRHLLSVIRCGICFACCQFMLCVQGPSDVVSVFQLLIAVTNLWYLRSVPPDNQCAHCCLIWLCSWPQQYDSRAPLFWLPIPQIWRWCFEHLLDGHQRLCTLNSRRWLLSSIFRFQFLGLKFAFGFGVVIPKGGLRNHLKLVHLRSL